MERKMITAMKAAVYCGPGDMRVEEVSEPNLTKTGIIIRVRSCGICGSDLHFYKLGGKRMHPGTIMGHEFSGDVVEVGGEVTGISPGDRVAAVSFLPCFRCAMCKAGLYELCPSQGAGGIDIPGAFAEYISIPLATVGKTVFKLSEQTTYDEGALIEPLGVGYLAAARGNPRPSDTIAIFGAGIIGLACLVALKARGTGKIIVSETSKLRLSMAGELGADILINAAEEDAGARIAQATDGRGLDMAYECTGVRKAFFTAIKALRFDGKLVQVGVFTEAFEFNPVTLTDKWLTITGFVGGDYLAASSAINGHIMDFKKLLTHEFPLQEITRAFSTQAQPNESIKVVVKP
jgi:threonine dehydrogenase-like Zn-dependent dehydrogenase